MANRNARPAFGITFKLTLAFVLFSLLIVGGIMGIVITTGREETFSAIFAELDSVASEKESSFNDWKAEHLGLISTLAGLPRVRDTVAALAAAQPGSADALKAHAELIAELKPWTGADESFIGLLVIEPAQGQVVAATNPSEEGKFKEDQLFFIKGKTSPTIQGPYYSITLQAPAITASAPILDSNGRLIAVLAGRLDLARLSSILTGNKSQYATRDVFFVNTSRLFVTQPRFVSDPAVLLRTVNTVAVSNCLTNGSGQTAEPDYRGVPVLAVYRWLPEERLCLIVKLDQSEARKLLDEFLSSMVFFGLTALALASALAYWMARRITRPVLVLQEAVTRFGRGELDVRLPVTSRDELGRLSQTFNEMAEALAERTNQLQAANKELEAFSYSVSHDLRAPLRAIDGFSRILLEKHTSSLDSEGARYFQLVRDNARQMGQLVDDLLAFSRLGRQALTRKPVSPRALVNQALADLQAEIDGRKMDIAIADLPECQADPSLLKQVFINLLANAVKFTRVRETAHIEIGFEKNDDEIVYYVRDNGVGFDMRYANKLFGVFQRLHSAEEFEGTGVGLAIVQRIVLRHGGRVWAEAEVDKGATFYFAIGRSSK